jgi:hypothetical protein
MKHETESSRMIKIRTKTPRDYLRLFCYLNEKGKLDGKFKFERKSSPINLAATSQTDLLRRSLSF